MALLNLGEDPWIREYESCLNLNRDIMEQLSQREKLPRKNEKYSQISAVIRLRLKQYQNEVDQLKQKLCTATDVGAITEAEAERRTRQLEILNSKYIQMQRLFSEQVSAKAMEERQELMGASTSGLKRNTDNYTIGELKNEHKTMLEEQERGLENLSQIISRQKSIANTISTEVDLHNEILDDLGTHMDRTDQRIRNETTHIGVVDNKDKTCIYWIVIILLFLSIVVVASL